MEEADKPLDWCCAASFEYVKNFCGTQRCDLQYLRLDSMQYCTQVSSSMPSYHVVLFDAE